MDTKELDCVLTETVDEQGFSWNFTIRASSAEEMFKKIDEYKDHFGINKLSPAPPRGKYASVAPVKAPQPPQAVQTTVAPQNLGHCEKCGAPMVISKRTGKPYCQAKCWLGKTY